ncbi:hypothetical protein ACJMQP_24925 [Rhodopseudomonas palustris]
MISKALVRRLFLPAFVLSRYLVLVRRFHIAIIQSARQPTPMIGQEIGQTRSKIEHL